jgi:hypothetical protein
LPAVVKANWQVLAKGASRGRPQIDRKAGISWRLRNGAGMVPHDSTALAGPKMQKIAALAALTLLAVSPVLAASGDAWAEFATEVEAACLDATGDVFESATAVVDPFGSESFGLAVVSGTVAGGATASVICVFDKQSKAVEIGGELAVAVTPVE